MNSLPALLALTLGLLCLQPTLSQTCLIPNCNSCIADPSICDTCADGFVLANGNCVSFNSGITCQDVNCDTCLESASVCTGCKAGFIPNNGVCISAGIASGCTDPNCNMCVGGSMCMFCNFGWILQGNACVQRNTDATVVCNDANCAVCKLDGTTCLLCQNNVMPINGAC